MKLTKTVEIKQSFQTKTGNIAELLLLQIIFESERHFKKKHQSNFKQTSLLASHSSSRFNYYNEVTAGIYISMSIP